MFGVDVFIKEVSVYTGYCQGYTKVRFRIFVCGAEERFRMWGRKVGWEGMGSRMRG